jgi:hypothetical protein
MKVSGQLHKLAVLPMENESPYPMDKSLGGPRNWSEHAAEGKNIVPCQELNPDSLVVQSIA